MKVVAQVVRPDGTKYQLVHRTGPGYKFRVLFNSGQGWKQSPTAIPSNVMDDLLTAMAIPITNNQEPTTEPV